MIQVAKNLLLQCLVGKEERREDGGKIGEGGEGRRGGWGKTREEGEGKRGGWGKTREEGEGERGGWDKTGEGGEGEREVDKEVNIAARLVLASKSLSQHTTNCHIHTAIMPRPLRERRRRGGGREGREQYGRKWRQRE